MDNFLNYYNLLPTELSAAVIVLNLLLALLLQLAVVFIYRRTRHGLSYSESFAFTLVMVGVLGCSIMMIVQNNIIGAFALLGAFALIRFRTILKESSDVAFVLFSLATGVAVGTNHYMLALITVTFLGVAIWGLRKWGFGSVSDNFDYLLIFEAPNTFAPATVETVLDKHARSREMLHTKVRETQTEYAYRMQLNNAQLVNELAQDIRGVKDIARFELLTGRSTAEY